MRKSLLTLAPAALALLACAGAVKAASNAQMTITANVVAATCDVSVSNPTLDLGNYTKSAFTGIATPVASSVKTFTVGLSNCEAPLAAGDTANLVISGQTLGGNPNIFNSTGTNTGIMISRVSSPTTYLKAGDKLLVATAANPAAAGDFNGKALSLQAGLASTSATPDIGAVSAPVVFSFAYN
ncbi:fimbrial protein [Serratia fonticola]|uniref:fimbrial protein n=1 Tax=Serratia fonticola TaxID=47917 RepID=UPI001646E16D|nr:type 1 fimbrial protein [Serratia fonticola]MBC3219660.1 type 1 fimbrial protein [Serratia fonticola]